MLYMVVERYVAGPGPVYERASTHGRMLPNGLHFVDSWVVDDDKLDRCFQLMETDDPALLDQWRERWRYLAEFDVFAVIKSDEAAGRVGVAWGRAGGALSPGPRSGSSPSGCRRMSATSSWLPGTTSSSAPKRSSAASITGRSRK